MIWLTSLQNKTKSVNLMIVMEDQKIGVTSNNSALSNKQVTGILFIFINISKTLALIRRASFWPPSVVYISVIITHILQITFLCDVDHYWLNLLKHSVNIFYFKIYAQSAGIGHWSKSPIDFIFGCKLV